MAFTTTWSFGVGYEGWTFEDTSIGAGNSATRSHVSGAIRIQHILVDVPPSTNFTQGLHFSPDLLNVISTNGDILAVDIGAPSDSRDTQVNLFINFTDETTETSPATVFNSAITKSYTITNSGKTVDTVEVIIARSPGGGAASDFTVDIIEVRYTTDNEITPTAGKLRTPQAFIEDEGAGAAGGAGGGGAGGNLAAISADGLSIYIASFNNLGFPTLIKMSALLAADGSVVFDPGAGGRIGVQTGEQNAETVWIAGNFGGTDTVEKSEDAGATFTVKDNAAIGTVRTFQVGPSDDERVLVFDGDNGDILETLDDGETWTTINAAVTPLINSLARLSTNLQEIMAGNQGDATDSINYSPNSGVNLEDYQTGVYPNADATKVQVT